VQKIN